MWSFKLFSALAFVNAVLVSGVLGAPGAAVVTSRDDIELEFGKEYSLEDLEQLFESRKHSGLTQSTILNSGPRVNTAAASAGIDDEKLFVTDTKTIWHTTFWSQCKYSQDLLDMQTFLSWKGTDIIFQRRQSIDQIYLEPTELSSEDSLYTRKAEFVHQACRPRPPNMMCAYKYTAQLTASVQLDFANRSSYQLESAHTNDEDPEKRPVVMETCRVIKRGEHKTCPPFDGKVCGIIRVDTFPILNS